MTKRKERDFFFKLLFMVGFFPPENSDEQIELFLSDNELEEFAEVFKERYHAFVEELPAIDLKIENSSEDWRIDRMARVDLTIIRLAVFEMTKESLDVGVAINEAVELAKTYGGERSYAFVNGVLAGIEE